MLLMDIFQQRSAFDFPYENCDKVDSLYSMSQTKSFLMSHF